MITTDMSFFWQFAKDSIRKQCVVKLNDAGLVKRRWVNGRLRPVIPGKLFEDALKHGFEIISADYRDNSYTMVRVR